MEITLIAVTLLALFLALSMGVVAWRLVEEERRRSDARLAALAAELRGGRGSSSDPGSEPFVPELPAADVAGADGPAADVAGADGPAAGLEGLFSPPLESTSTGWTRLAAIGGAAVVVLSVVAATLLLSGSDDGDAAATAEDVRPPLDLIALGHTEEGPFLDISGSVRNPATGAGVERLSVVALAFDEAGTLIATRRMTVEVPALAAGADSPFVVRLEAAGIRRYRISFLLDDTPVSHIDRRSAVPMPAPTGGPP